MPPSRLLTSIAGGTQMHHHDAAAALLLYVVRDAVAEATQGGHPSASRERDGAEPERGRGFVLADRIERLVYSREQAAEALGISLATLDRRVVPVIATVKTEWGARLIPVAELERYLADRTVEARVARRVPRRAGSEACCSGRYRRANPRRARARHEPWRDRAWAQRRPCPDRSGRAPVVAVDGAICSCPPESA